MESLLGIRGTYADFHIRTSYGVVWTARSVGLSDDREAKRALCRKACILAFVQC
jgi:hypothetical protein